MKYLWFNLRDKIRIFLGYVFFNWKKTYNQEYKNEIIFYRADGKIGDTIIFSSILAPLKEQFPQLKITLVITQELYDLYHGHILADNVIISPSYNHLNYKQISELTKRIGAVKYLVNLDSYLKLKGAYFFHNVLSQKTFGALNRNSIDINLVKKYNDKSERDLYQQILVELGGHAVKSDYIIPDSLTYEHKVKAFKQDSNLIVINGFGAGSDRCFTKETLSNVISIVRKKYPNHKIAALYTNKHFETVSNACAENKIEMYSDLTDLLDVIELIRQSSLVISVDTATVHIAEGLHKPLIALYNISEKDFKRWKPTETTTSTLRVTLHNYNDKSWFNKLEQLL